MEILVLPIFISVVLVVGALFLFVCGVNNRDLEHQEEASLMPLEDDE